MSGFLHKNKPIAFLGFGELGQQIYDLLPKFKEQIVIFDDAHSQASFLFNQHEQNAEAYQWVVAIGYKHLKTKVKLINTILENGGSLLSVIHSSCFVNRSAFIDNGAILYPMCNIDKDVKIEAGCLLNNSVIVSHNCVVGKGSYLSPGVILSGNVTIGKGCFLGAGCIIANGVTIGDYATVGIGTVVSKNIPSYTNVIGNPMRFLTKKLNLI
jgi:sugar O-acyltransferase (sialic acid O-acetyltransferase NeuD family)